MSEARTNGNGTAPVAGPVVRADRWSNNKVKNAKRKELVDRLRHLESQVPERAPEQPASVVDPLAVVDETRDMLTLAMPALNETVAFFAGETFRHSESESAALCTTLAPPLAPHYDRLRTVFPWVGAIATAVGVYAPKVFEAMRAERLRKAEAVDVTVTTSPSNGASPSEPGNALRPYGGPDE